MFRTAIVLLAMSAAVLGCEPPNCDRPDEGSCGNACCGLDITIKQPTEVVEQMLLKVLSNGGPDGRYILSMTAEGTLGFYDLRPYKLAADFIGQVVHHTKVHDYNDTIDMTLINDNGNTIVHAFSTSQIAGAFGDAGQNYKNIIQFINALDTPFDESTFIGCPAPSKKVVAEPEVLHASCRLTWTFTSSCETVSAAIVTAINDLSGLANCDSSEKCGYTLKEHNSTYISAQHETPKAHYVDDLYMNFRPAGESCDVMGYSTSTIWYAVLDDGTNYCNLHNLAEHTQLSFDESTNNNICTQYTSANCAKY